VKWNGVLVECVNGNLRVTVCSSSAWWKISMQTMTEVFTLKVKTPYFGELGDFTPTLDDTFKKERCITPTGVDQDTLDKLWDQKNRLDKMFDEEVNPRHTEIYSRKELYYEYREHHFPIEKTATKAAMRRRGNNAGWKFREICEGTGFLEEKRNYTFLDICGGPGAWSQELFKEPDVRKGYGISLREGTAKECVWYDKLTDGSFNFRAVWGPDKDGNVMQDFEALSKEIEEQVDFVLCDGGDGYGVSQKKGVHFENYEELLVAPLICAELRLGLKNLKPGGRLCIKLYDTFTDFTASILWGLCQVFEKVQLFKPQGSRACNSERYVVAFGFREDAGDFLTILIQRLDAAMKCARSSKEDSDIMTSNLSVVTLFPLDILHGDAEFVDSLRAVTDKLAKQQTEALKLILDDVDANLGKARQKGEKKEKRRRMR